MVFFNFLRFLSRSGTCGSSGEWQPDQARLTDKFGTVGITLDHLAKHWDQGLEMERKIKVLKRIGFFLTLMEFLARSGTCGSSGEWQPDQVRPMDEFGTVVTLWITWPSVGIMPGWKEIRVKVLHNIRFLFQL